MPSTEHRVGDRSHEEGSTSSYKAARFPSEKPAGEAYFQAQEVIFKADCDLSVYRLRLNRIWHLAVLGDPPPPA